MNRLFHMLALLMCAGTAAAAQETGAGWRIVLEGSPAPDSALDFAAMAPGWQLTARAAALAYDPDNAWTGNDSLEAVVYLFSSAPGTGAGIMLGGNDLGTGSAHYVAFEVGPDGRYRITRRSQGVTTELIPWHASEAVPRHPGGQGNVRAVLAVRSDSLNVRFQVNGTVVATLPRPSVAPAGAVGFRVERGTSAHITTFSIGGRNVAPVAGRPS
jgi:hypothetical protein